MFSEQTLDVFLISPCPRRIVLRNLIIEIIFDDGHMVKTRHCCPTQPICQEQNPPLLCHIEPICKENKTRHCCPTQNQSLRNTKPAPAVLHRTNLSRTQNPPLLCYTQSFRRQNPPLRCYTKPICENTKPDTAVLQTIRTQIPPLLCYTESICQEHKPATAVLHRTNLPEHKTRHCSATQNQSVRNTKPIYTNTKPATAVLHRINLSEHKTRHCCATQN